MSEWIVTGPDAMREAGRRLGELLNEGDAVALIGPLGAGKTTLTQGIAEGLDVTGEVSSPTFALMNVYEGRVALYHLDMYRLEDPDRLALLGYEPETAETGVTLVEWADKHWPFWNDDVLTIKIALHGDARSIAVSHGGPRSEQLFGTWKV